MLRQQAKSFNYLLRAFDGGIIVIAFLLVYYIRTWFPAHFSSLSPLLPLHEYLGILVLAVLLWIIVLKYNGGYESFRKRTYPQTSWIITKASVISMVFIFSVLFITKSNHISRIFIVLFVLTASLLLISGRFGLITFLRKLRGRGYNYRNVLMVGTGKRARNYAERIYSHSELGLRIFGYVDDQPTKHDQQILGNKIIGKLKDVPSIIQNSVIDEVVVALPHRLISHIGEILWVCEETGIEVTMVVDFFDNGRAKLYTSNLYGIPLLSFSTTSSEQLQLLFKDFFDRFAVIILLILTSPLLVAASLAIKFTSAGPIFFRQTRTGLNGRKFTMYKFRSMVANAEEQLEELKKCNEVSGPVFKMADDPRVTPVGQFLRRTSIDELPQLINVLRGEMSLVGPRPPLPDEINHYHRWQRRRLSVKPGITCLWQVSGRSYVGFKEWMELDLRYIDNWSLWLDLRILLKTFVAVIKGKGAY